MRRRKRRYMHRRTLHLRGAGALLFLLLLLFLLGFLAITVKLRPVIREYAESRAVNLASSGIHDAVEAVLSKGEIGYRDLIDLEKDAEGHVTALHTNIVAVNRLKAEIASAVIADLSSIDTAALAIPLGTISGIDFLSGMGPRLHVELAPLGEASAAFGSRFTSAGINQTRHSIVMEVTAAVTILLPGEQIEAEVRSTIDVAETVIVGVVPDSYTNVEDPDGSKTDLIFDFAQ